MVRFRHWSTLGHFPYLHKAQKIQNKNIIRLASMTESDSKIYWLRLYQNKCIFVECHTINYLTVVCDLVQSG